MTTTEPTPDENADKGDGPSSHETSGDFPADDVRGGPAEERDPDDKGDGPASNETSGQFPADDVAESGGYVTVGPEGHDVSGTATTDPDPDGDDK